MGSAADKGCIEFDENFNVIQSLAILRTIVFRCHWSRHTLSMMTYTHRTTCSLMDEVFPTPRVLVNLRDIQLRIEKAEDDRKNAKQLDVDGAIRSLLTPFLHIIRLKESDGDFVDKDLELLCTQTIEKMKTTENFHEIDYIL